MGARIGVFDLELEEEFTTCYIELMVQRGPDDYSFFNAGLFVPVSAFTAALTAGFMLRRRRIETFESDPESEGTGFELFSDPNNSV